MIRASQQTVSNQLQATRKPYCWSKSVYRLGASQQSGSNTLSSKLHWQPVVVRLAAFQKGSDSDSASNDDLEKGVAAAASSSSSASSTNDKGSPSQSSLPSLRRDKDGGGVLRTILLAIPLFCKFVIVLMIKFLTDLVVFPLLWMYRLARLTKRKVLNMFRGHQLKHEKPNGESTSGSSSSSSGSTPPR